MEQVWIDDWLMYRGKWHRFKKTRDDEGVLRYYVDGKKVHEMPYDEMKKMHRKLSGKE